MRVITYEDRPHDITGLKLLLLSLQQCCPGLEVDVLFPNPPHALTDWVQKLESVRIVGDEYAKSGYDMKPGALRRVLEDGEDRAVWLDTDIIITRDFRPMLAKIPLTHVVVTEEWFGAPYQGGTHRSEKWKIPTGRNLPATANTCVVGMSTVHLDLLNRWDALLNDPIYKEAQDAPWHARPIHLMSDQELLTALLESKAHSEIPIRFLHRGSEVAHCFQHQGYILHQMLFNFVSRNKPFFVHGQGTKPWRKPNTFPLHNDTSPYTLCAIPYLNDLDETTNWILPQTSLGKRLRTMFHDNPWTTSLPIAFIEELKNQRVVRTTVKRLLNRA